jgi:hypothetical protein
VREFPKKFCGIVNYFSLFSIPMKEYLTYTYIAWSGEWPCKISEEILIVGRIDDWGVKSTKNHWPSSYRGRSCGSPKQKGFWPIIGYEGKINSPVEKLVISLGTVFNTL